MCSEWGRLNVCLHIKNVNILLHVCVCVCLCGRQPPFWHRNQHKVRVSFFLFLMFTCEMGTFGQFLHSQTRKSSHVTRKLNHTKTTRTTFWVSHQDTRWRGVGGLDEALIAADHDEFRISVCIYLGACCPKNESLCEMRAVKNQIFLVTNFNNEKSFKCRERDFFPIHSQGWGQRKGLAEINLKYKFRCVKRQCSQWAKFNSNLVYENH